MLFVGLGGTGLRIGAELERALRRELCGPDGMALTAGGRRLPYQLPDCLQFVYADFSEGELTRLPHLATRGPEAAALRQTARAIHDLLPAGYVSSPDVTRSLRVNMPEETASWLPPQQGQPRVAPLNKGAGQLPTVGRAALFGTLRDGLEPVLRQVRAAVGAIGTAAGDLRELGGGHIRGCDVFVAFSVAGGTGAGIFYDFLHLIGHEFRAGKVPGVQIYPLVVMPSAFPPEAGGGREAQLNAARALVDLSRLVDDQNAPGASDDFGDVDRSGDIGVHYPRAGRITLQPSTAQTAFLFSRPVGIRPEDLRRSITALVMSLVGTELGDREAPGRAETDYQSFADSFINRSIDRARPARSGIGQCGMSTSLAASLTVPVDDLAEIVAGRLLAAAVGGMADAARRPDEEGTDRVRQMFERSGIGPLWNREPRPVTLPDPLPKGGRAIAGALRDRLADMEDELSRLDRGLDREVGRLIDDFSPAAASRDLLAELGPFRLERVLNGFPGHPQRAAVAGFAGMLENRRAEPERPDGVEMSPPAVPAIHRRMAGVAPARWGDPEVQRTLDEQDTWYRWRSRRVWHRCWKEQETRWRPALERTRRDLAELVGALREHEQAESRSFAERRKELYRDDRQGVCYLLPPQNSLRAFYDAVFDRLRVNEGLKEAAEEAELLERLIDPATWQRAWDVVRRSPAEAVREIKQVVERRVKQLFVETGVYNERPLVPSLADLLRAAAGDQDAAGAVDDQWLEQFRSQIARLLPVGFSPDGNGPLKILIVYPGSEAAARAQSYLAQALNLPRDAGAVPEFRPVSRDSISVVLFRSGMSLTDVSEVRQVLGVWAQARDAGTGEDFLEWRQRLGYGDDWLASTEEDRRRILHRLLCAMWNGWVDVKGDPESPRAVRVRLHEGGSASMTLRLEAFDEQASSWAGLLKAYEQWAMLDEGTIVGDFCHALMQARPRGLTNRPAAPSPLFLRFVHDVAPRQAALVEKLAADLGEHAEAWLAPLRQFWGPTLKGALDLPFPGVVNPIRPTLRGLDERHRAATQAAAGAPDDVPDDDGPDDGPGDPWWQGTTAPEPEPVPEPAPAAAPALPARDRRAAADPWDDERWNDDRWHTGEARP